MSAKKHTHKYFRTVINGQRVWRCALEDCTHYMPKHLEDELMSNRKSVCWDCGEHFPLGPYTLQMDKPICLRCQGLDKINETGLDEEKIDKSIQRDRIQQLLEQGILPTAKND